LDLDLFKGENMTQDKQRVDAYVLAVMAGTVGNISLLSASATEYGYKEIFKLAKGMMTYVDEQQKEQEEASWTENTGEFPSKLRIFDYVDIVFSDGEILGKVQPGDYSWGIDTDVDSTQAYHITKWRLS
jgi:hypothetical protein